MENLDEERRLKLHAKLREVTGIPNLYYEPPINTYMDYPCIRYFRRRLNPIYADNRTYSLLSNTYELTVIYHDVTADYARLLLENFSGCSYDRGYVVDGLHHDVLLLSW